MTWDNNAWSLSNGVVNVLDPGVNLTTPRAYPAVELWRQGMLHVRHRLNYASNTPDQVATRAANVFRLMGDDLIRAGGFGETIGSRPVTSSTTFEPVAKAIAQVGWKLQNHTDFYADVDFQVAAFQRIAAEIPIKDMRWQLIHCFQTTSAQLQTMKALGVGVDVENERYLDRLMRGPGPFYRLMVDSGITMGAGTDGSNFCPNNPWLNIYYMTTGVNVRGIPENASQKISRLEAIPHLDGWQRLPELRRRQGLVRGRQGGGPRRSERQLPDLYRRQAAQDQVCDDDRRRQGRARGRLPRLRDHRRQLPLHDPIKRDRFG